MSGHTQGTAYVCLSSNLQTANSYSHSHPFRIICLSNPVTCVQPLQHPRQHPRSVSLWLAFLQLPPGHHPLCFSFFPWDVLGAAPVARVVWTAQGACMVAARVATCSWAPAWASSIPLPSCKACISSFIRPSLMCLLARVAYYVWSAAPGSTCHPEYASTEHASTEHRDSLSCMLCMSVAPGR